MNKEKIERLLDLVEHHGGHTLSANCEICLEITKLKTELFEDVAKALLFDALQNENKELISKVVEYMDQLNEFATLSRSQSSKNIQLNQILDKILELRRNINVKELDAKTIDILNELDTLLKERP